MNAERWRTHILAAHNERQFQGIPFLAFVRRWEDDGGEKPINYMRICVYLRHFDSSYPIYENE